MTFEDKIKLIIENYKYNFEAKNDCENYKWEAYGHYRDNWNINADDFGAMVENAFSKMDNLLQTHWSHANNVICAASKLHPEEVRELFKELYNEDIPFEKRFNDFREPFPRYIKEIYKGKDYTMHHQDLHTISIYLSAEYPDKYYIYKATPCDTFRKRLGYEKEKGLSKVDNYMKFCDEVLQIVEKDSELISMKKNKLDSSCAQDESLHLLAFDIIYHGGQCLTEAEFNDILDGKTVKWIPDSKGVSSIAKKGIEEDKAKEEGFIDEFIKAPPKPKTRLDTTVYSRNKKTAENALNKAGHKCEFNPSHESFIRKGTDEQYTEPHHLIPLYVQDYFDVSLDQEANIVSLCSNCHNWIHYGENNKIILKKLFDERKEKLKEIGINISFNELMKYYK